MLSLEGGQLSMAFHHANCKISSGEFLPFIDPGESLAIKYPCKGNGINIIDCKMPQKDIFIEEINGLDFNTVLKMKDDDLDLPNYIPIISAEFFGIDSQSILQETIGVALKDIIISHSKIKPGILELPVFRNKKVILFMSGPDEFIENVWWKSGNSELFEQIGSAGFTAVTAINFSVFFGECPLAHAINLKKSLKILQLIESAGGNIIPHLYWANKNHLRRWVEWLNRNQKVKNIVVNCQSYKKSDYTLLKYGLEYIKLNVNRSLRFVLEGPKSRHLKFLNQEIKDSLSLVYKVASYNTRNYRQFFASSKVGLTVQEAIIKNQKNLLIHNIKTYAAYSCASVMGILYSF
jgi:hypothetical protein